MSEEEKTSNPKNENNGGKEKEKEEEEEEGERKDRGARESFLWFLVKILTWAIIFAFGFFVFSNTLENDFVYDDREAVVNNPDVKPSTPISFLLTDDW